MPQISCNCGGFKSNFEPSEVEWESEARHKNGPGEPPEVKWQGTYEVECPKCGKLPAAVFLVHQDPDGAVKSTSTKHFFCTVDGSCLPAELS